MKSQYSRLAYYYCVVFPLTFSSLVYGQNPNYNVLGIAPIGSIYFPEQLFDQVIVTNSTPNSTVCLLEMQISNAVGEMILTGITPIFEVGSGVNSYPINLDIGYDITYGSGEIVNALQFSGFLPVGEYVVCYRLMSNGTAQLASSCLEFSVEGLVGPIAINPSGGDTILTCSPFFNWIPIFPDYPGVSYTFGLYLVEADQTVQDALLLNTPSAVITSIEDNFIHLTSSYLVLQDSLLYAWQVTALGINQSVLGQTEIESFIPVCAIETVVDTNLAPSYMGYVEAQRAIDEGFVPAYISDTLRIVYKNVSGAEFLDYDVIYADSVANEQSVDLQLLPIFELNPGVNLIDIPLEPLVGLLKENYFFYVKFHQESCELKLKYLLQPPPE